MEEQKWSVLTCLPNNGQKCLCFGHKTYCCSEDMDENPDWHEVTFSFQVSEYKIKKQLPEDIEDTILEYCKVVECWDIIDLEYPGYGAREHVIGVTEWKPILTEN